MARIRHHVSERPARGMFGPCGSMSGEESYRPQASERLARGILGLGKKALVEEECLALWKWCEDVWHDGQADVPACRGVRKGGL